MADAPERAAAPPRPAAAGPAALPAPARPSASFLARYGGDLADPYVLVKYAVRYKEADETIGARVYPLASGVPWRRTARPSRSSSRSPRSPRAPPAGIRYAEIPAVGPARRGARDREGPEGSPARQAGRNALGDPVTETVSLPAGPRGLRSAAAAAGVRRRSRRSAGAAGEEAARPDGHGAGARRRRNAEKWVAWGSAMFSNIGLFTGRKRTISGVRGPGEAPPGEHRRGPGRVPEGGGGGAGGRGGFHGRCGPGPLSRRNRSSPPAGGVDLLRYDVLWVY